MRGKRRSGKLVLPCSSLRFSSVAVSAGLRISATNTDRIIDRLYKVIVERRDKPRENSYTSRLLSGGAAAVGGKVLEEAEDLVEALSEKGPEDVLNEAADLVYHTLVLMADAEVTPYQVKQELTKRFGIGGISEKASRGHSRVQDPKSKEK